jgi:hypothetical protein
MTRRDPDQRHPLHDALCAYLSDPEIARELFRALSSPSAKPVTLQCTRQAHYAALSAPPTYRWELSLDDWQQRSAFSGTEYREVNEGSVATRLEQPVYADRGRYKQLVGFLDVYLQAESRTWAEGVVAHEGRLQDVTLPLWTYDYAVAIEVKARMPSVGEVIRQIQKYRHEWATYFVEGSAVTKPTRWIVCCPQMPGALVELLRANDIVGIQPNPSFLPWCEQHGVTLPDHARALCDSPQRALPGI